MEIEYDDRKVVSEAVAQGICTSEEAWIFIRREHEYLMARGIEGCSDDGYEKPAEPPTFDLSEQFFFCKKSTPLHIETICELLRIELIEQLRIGLIEGLQEEEIPELTKYTIEDCEKLEEEYDFSYIMYKIGYMYENGIGFDQDVENAHIWYIRAHRNGWDDKNTFSFSKYTPSPVRKPPITKSDS